MNILFIGDIVGKVGRIAVKEEVPILKKKYKIDLVIANAENSAHGRGITEKIYYELRESGVDVVTMGDHAFDEKVQISNIISKKEPIVTPANFSPNAPGKGYYLVETKKHKILVINLIGRVFMRMDYGCPFQKIDKILANFAKQKISAIIVDIHAEATSEKIALMHYLDGRVSAVLGTHTHVMTADSQITNEGTAYITDVGMTGYSEGCIGIEKEAIIETFLTQIKTSHNVPDKGRYIFNAVVMEINARNGKTLSITPLVIKSETK